MRDVTDLREAIRDLTESRARIVAAGDAERRRVERNLHDGAQQRLVTVALLAGLWLHPPTDRVNNKSNMHRVAVIAEPQIRDGDIVISTHPEQVPVADFYFEPEVRWAA